MSAGDRGDVRRGSRAPARSLLAALGAGFVVRERRVREPLVPAALTGTG